MAILDGDIQLLQSEVMDDVDEGGGMATGIAIVDGASNNMFPDISELDRTYGRISLRKMLPAVVTDNTDSYFGAHAIVAAPPADPKVSVTLFSTANWFDHRTDARNKLESYISASGEGRWMLYGRHLAGQRTVQLHCPASAPTPGVDEVLKLQSASTESTYQYVRIARIVSRDVGTAVEDSKGTYYRDLITVEISDALRYTFDAATMERWTVSWYAPPTRIHKTIAADAASYYGIQPLRVASLLGDLKIKAQSIYTQLVPSALSETPIVDARCTGDRSLVVAIAGASATSFSVAINVALGVASVLYVGHPVARGTLSMTGAGVTLTDDGNGGLVATSGYAGTVDYTTGTVSLSNSLHAIAATFSVGAAPAAVLVAAGRTEAIAITLGNRGYTYVKTLSPAPGPGSVELSYMAQGKWYSLLDDGNGNLVGEAGTGTGSINYATGAVVVTLGALPDVDTSLLFAWGSPASVEPQVGTAVFSLPSIKFTVSGGALTPGSLSVSYLSGGVAKTVTDDGAGNLTGVGSGYVDYANGLVVIRPTLLPDAGSALAVNYTQGLTVGEVFAASGAVNTFTLAHAVKPGTLSLAFSDTAGNRFLVGDNGAGLLVLRSVGAAPSGIGYNGQGQLAGGMSQRVTGTSGVAGSINYATGAVSLAASITITTTTFTGLVFIGSNSTSVAAGSITATYRQASDNAGGTQALSVPLDPLVLDLLPSVSNSLVPGSLRFSIGGDTFVDRAGTIVRNPSHTTNSGTVAGTINYLTGVVTLTSWPGGVAPAASVAAMTRLGAWTDWRLSFRTSGAPIQTASLYVTAVRADNGATLSATADASGALAASGVVGVVDVTTGIATVRFGGMVAAAGNEAEWWYDAANVVGGQIFKPILVLPETAKYNAVATASLPLSADVLGLDPVRLPADGRVPIFRKGGVVVVHHTATTAPQAVSNGQTVNLGRVRLAKVRVVGNNGQTITAGYSTDLDAGTVTFTAVAGYSQPVRIEDRIEDMALISDVQINGELTLTRALSHNFPLGSYVSSALIIGDLRARVSVFFDQQTWSGWADALAGSAAVGTYNKAQYPVVVVNRGCIQERWEIVFTNTTTVNVIGENVGQILTGVPIAADIAPINPATGTPYFTLAAAGWGNGWSAGNVLRFNTIAANYPLWAARTVLQGNATVQNDKFAIGIRGDIDA